jgi:eukaryotic-like serine/threonine-protein kinase
MPVDPKQVQAVFLAAVGCAEPSERAAVLERECRDYAELRAQVEALLKAHGDGSGFLPTIDRTTPADSGFVPIGEGPGTTIGRYKLLQQIGEGGFGTVFLAEQEQPVRRKVALKIIKPGMDTRQVIARFVKVSARPSRSWTTPISPRFWTAEQRILGGLTS